MEKYLLKTLISHPITYIITFLRDNYFPHFSANVCKLIPYTNGINQWLSCVVH